MDENDYRFINNDNRFHAIFFNNNSRSPTSDRRRQCGMNASEATTIFLTNAERGKEYAEEANITQAFVDIKIYFRKVEIVTPPQLATK